MTPSPFLLEAFTPEELGLDVDPEERVGAIVAR
jgi:hypothetical protein